MTVLVVNIFRVFSLTILRTEWELMFQKLLNMTLVDFSLKLKLTIRDISLIPGRTGGQKPGFFMKILRCNPQIK
ncbi:MAG: hypothetical protein EAZ60_22765 [Oscillatoriales cyanobacterium]|nr:MAG: hypothetical protein EAZ79_05935 [Oscillatoriales cyanobacterium]TAF20041.1 MAG: hypothetical protein EAZ73_12905 [Oscillatoriales cyanobacterium]TAF30673.1 MAG: hypothetical protein EAZ69_21350 [Oscillatoriales cyanobacterium]TAF52756.1 MAG: hypothetical protein EAZ60_22765 [Oscillatoriales cyanobacterium]